MGATERFSRNEVQRILDVTGKQLDYWERLRLVSPQKGPQKGQGDRFYDFRDLIGLRTVKQLVLGGVPANRLRRALTALREKLSHVQAPLTELRILSNGKDVLVERDGARLEPLSGQFVLNFETRELKEGVRVIPERTADEWMALAADYEADRKTWAEAIDAYQRVLRMDPGRCEALINCGTLYYEQGNLEQACDCFRKAVELEPEDALAHFNLGSVLDDAGEVEPARQHLRLAVRLDPHYPDAHYNLAIVCEKLGSYAEARQHWQAYIELDPTSPWCDYARQRLTSSNVARSATPS